MSNLKGNSKTYKTLKGARIAQSKRKGNWNITGEEGAYSLSPVSSSSVPRTLDDLQSEHEKFIAGWIDQNVHPQMQTVDPEVFDQRIDAAEVATTDFISDK